MQILFYQTADFHCIGTDLIKFLSIRILSEGREGRSSVYETITFELCLLASCKTRAIRTSHHRDNKEAKSKIIDSSSQLQSCCKGRLQITTSEHDIEHPNNTCDIQVKLGKLAHLE